MTLDQIKAGAVPTDDQFKAALDAYVAGAQKKIDDHYAKYLSNLQPDKLITEQGSRFVKVWSIGRDTEGRLREDTHKRIFAFIDRQGGTVEKVPTNIGAVLKPAGWKKPAKHERGNIFAPDNGLNCTNNHGPEYLR